LARFLCYDKLGNLVWETDYDIYGDLREFKGDRNFIPFRQLGQYEDLETGLYYNRFRYYNPDTGLYLSQDPIGLFGGMALYAFVHDANSFVDIFGLMELFRSMSRDEYLDIKTMAGMVKIIWDQNGSLKVMMML
jgi:RHS repeat-associated protein